MSVAGGYNASLMSNTAAWLVVRAVWLAASAAVFWFVGTFQTDIPCGDEFDLVPVATGHRALTAEWLWSPHNQHRVVLPRLVQLGLLRATGTDFRAGTWLIAVLLGGLALGMIVVAERVRGRSAVSDAFLPLVGLHWGQVENLIWNWQLQFVLGIALTTGALAVVVLSGNNLKLRSALLAGVCLLLLPLCGGNGVLSAAPMSIWLGWQAVVGWGTPRLGGVRGSIAVLALTAGTWLLCGAYLTGLPSDPPRQEGIAVEERIVVFLAFLAVGFGPAVGPLWWVGSVTMVAGLVFVGIMLTRAAWRRPGERWRAAGLAGLLAALPAAAVVVGYTRADDGPEAGFQSRYSTLWVPAWWAVYFAVTLYLPGAAGRVVRWGLLAVSVAMLWNAEYGLDYATRMQSRRAAFERDLDARTPSFVLARRYFRHPFGLFASDPVALDGWLMNLHEAGVGRFARMRPTPPHRDVRLDATNSEVGPDFGLLRLKPPRTVYAVRFILKCDGARGSGQNVAVSWRGGTAGSVELTGILRYWHEHIIPIDGPVEEFRLATPPGQPPVTVGPIVVSVPPDASALPAGPAGVR